MILKRLMNLLEAYSVLFKLLLNGKKDYDIDTSLLISASKDCLLRNSQTGLNEKESVLVLFSVLGTQSYSQITEDYQEILDAVNLIKKQDSETYGNPLNIKDIFIEKMKIKKDVSENVSEARQQVDPHTQFKEYFEKCSTNEEKLEVIKEYISKYLECPDEHDLNFFIDYFHTSELTLKNIFPTNLKDLVDNKDFYNIVSTKYNLYLKQIKDGTLELKFD